ncbi:MAG TPA: MerR family transcriptional regulator [Candidatus Baltobacteraceae bacterium]|nr:MerR family transcriptional regulator [Candidatus Baltobacteraceae bacterium]
MNTFTVGEVARRSGVTVRTLHHYERIGLLCASERSEAGHRRYGPREIVRLRHIVTLAALGLPLQEIATMLDGSPAALRDALRAQRQLLARKRDALQTAIERIDALEQRSANGAGDLTRVQLEHVMESIAMERWAHRYMTEVRGASAEEADAALRSATPEAADGSRRWAELIADVEAALADGSAPNSERGRDLARRWRALIDAFTGGDAVKEREVRNVYATLPEGFPKPYSDEVEAFIREAGWG